jgi:hypothetical protein
MFDSQIRRNITIALFFANMGIVAFGRCLFVGFFFDDFRPEKADF